MIGRQLQASRFAVELSEALGAPKMAKALHQNPEAEHKQIGDVLKELLDAKVAALTEAGALPPGTEGRVDWEGRKRATTERQAQSYPILGTWTHPDAAVVAPFTLAIEFDREPTSADYSHFKECLLKAAVHVLSGAYDASLLVFALKREESSPEIYLNYEEDTLGYTARLLEILKSHGLHVLFLAPL